MTRVLEGNGVRVLAARHGGHAMLACLAHDGRIDLLVTELDREEECPKVLAARLRRLRPGLEGLFFGDAVSTAPGVRRRPRTAEELLKAVDAALVG